MAWISGGLRGDRIAEWVVETRYLASRVSGGIGVKYASNFGNPERFAKEKRREVSRLYKIFQRKHLSFLTSHLSPHLKHIRRLLLNLLQLIFHVHH